MFLKEDIPFPKVICAIVASTLALALPLFFLPDEEAIILVKRCGFWFMFVTCCFFLWQLWHEARHLSFRKIRSLLSENYIGVFIVLFVTIFLQYQDEQKYKILYDEHLLSSTAVNLYENQFAYVEAASHVHDGETVASIGHVDKRPLLFPFILATVHNVLGYDYENAFLLNALLAGLLLALVYSVVTILTDKRYGCIAVLLLGGLPLLAQNATGGGYELLNLCFIIGLALTSYLYFRQEDGVKGLNLMLITAVLLANIRYESLLYVLVPVGLFLLKCYLLKEIHLTWFSVFSPLLLIPPLTSFAIFQNEPVFFITSKEDFFSLSHFPQNLSHAGSYLFDWSGSHTNSILLSIVGIPCTLAFLVWLVPQIRKNSFTGDKATIAFFSVLLVVLSNTFLALCNHWGAWTDPATSRFSLPLHLIMAVCTALVMHRLFKRKSATYSLIIGAGLYLIFVTPAHCYRMRQEPRLAIADGYHWSMHWIKQRASNRNELYLVHSATGIGLLPVGALPFRTANALPERIYKLKKIGFYEDIFAVEALVKNERGMSPLVPGPGALSHLYEVETIAQAQITKRLTYRISRVIGLNTHDGKLDDSYPETQTFDPVDNYDFYRQLPLSP
ncbi:hypothetical protein DDZ13_01390 [Coraliomargarita sinensis]|uniref:Glycosyltransferase RgtA/B/C/D-like domain-containing protein n=1 Tax=Coraliomargarita sinensis TaxID=2174842 RepID=A0A317ZIL1_9BACT|nr:glycosyltransferase family 39 protein [Coraliomargarita sinensis]PXA05554.1 hypothetical protein DDZ13_01390 [Coraliomargarita sinensis]